MGSQEPTEPMLTEPLKNIAKYIALKNWIPDNLFAAVAPLAWVPWVPGNPSVFEQWVPEPINFETKKLNLPIFCQGKNKKIVCFWISVLE